MPAPRCSCFCCLSAVAPARVGRHASFVWHVGAWQHKCVCAAVAARHGDGTCAPAPTGTRLTRDHARAIHALDSPPGEAHRQSTCSHTRAPYCICSDSTDNKQAQECAACACMLLHCCAALMHRADACAALQLLLLPVCCGACSRRPPCIIRVARRRLATQMCLCRGCCQTWRWHLRPCAHRHTADTRPRTRDTRA